MMKELYFLSVVQIMQSISTELAAQFQPHYDYLSRGLIVCLYQANWTIPLKTTYLMMMLEGLEVEVEK